MRRFAVQMMMVSVLVGLMASPALAQVAAPRLNPIFPEAPEAFNPATLPWSGPSRIGAAINYTSTTETVQNEMRTLNAEGDGKFLGMARMVGDIFALSVEALEVDSTLTGTDQTGVYTASMINVATLLGGSIGLGAGQQNNNVKSEGTDTGLAFEKESDADLLQMGVVFQLGEALFIGASGGTETLAASLVSPGLGVDINEAIERDVSRFGIGYFSRGNSGGFHAEVYREAKELGDFTDAGITTVPETDTAGITLEFVFYTFLLGVEKIATKERDATGITKEVDDVIVSMGWVPAQGLAITATLYDTENTTPGSTAVELEEATFVGIAWLF